MCPQMKVQKLKIISKFETHKHAYLYTENVSHPVPPCSKERNELYLEHKIHIVAKLTIKEEYLMTFWVLDNCSLSKSIMRQKYGEPNFFLALTFIIKAHRSRIY